MKIELGTILPFGPYTVSGAWVTGKYAAAIGLSILLLGMTVGLAFAQVSMAQNFLRIAAIAEGAERTDSVGFDGEVETTNIIFMEYKLNVEYMVDEENSYSIRSEFYRFFIGPKEDDPVWVLYDPTNPQRAVLSWEFEALGHGWIMFGLLILLSVALLFGIYAIITGAKKAVDTAKRLAANGKLAWLEVTGVETKTGQSAQSIVKFILPNGSSGSVSYAKAQKKSVCMTNEESKILMLVLDEEYLPIQANGAPLSLKTEN